MGKGESQPKDIGSEEQLMRPRQSGVQVGDCVEFRFEGESPERVKLVPAGEGTDCDVGDCVAADTPFGKAVDGRVPGEILSFKTPAGEQRIQIIGISKCDDERLEAEKVGEDEKMVGETEEL